MKNRLRNSQGIYSYYSNNSIRQFLEVVLREFPQIDCSGGIEVCYMKSTAHCQVIFKTLKGEESHEIPCNGSLESLTRGFRNICKKIANG